MIRYTLTCTDGHVFDSWFQSSDAFDTLMSRGMVVCETCGSTEVTKSLMAPGVGASSKGKDDAGGQPAQPMAAGPLSKPGSEMEQMLQKLRAHVEENSTYVGKEFAREARDMHLGDAPERQIHGEASQAEAMALLEDGVPILPLPGVPKAKSN